MTRRARHTQNGRPAGRGAAVTRDAVEILRRRDAHDATVARLVAEEEGAAAVARQVYALRMRHGLTQAELAARVGTHQRAIARLEDAEYGGHSLRMLMRVAAALGYGVAVQFVPRPSAPARPSRRVRHAA